MKTNKKIQSLLNHGFKPSTILQLKEGEINILYKKILEQASPQNTTMTQKTVKTYKVNPNSKTMINGLEIDTSGGQTKVTPMETEMKEEMDFLKGKKKKEVKEKSVSKQQQKFFGVVRGMQKGDIPKKGKAGKAAEEMSKKDVKDFASTKHKNLPNKVEKKETKENYMDMVGKSMSNNYLKNGLNKMNLGFSYDSAIKENIEKMVDKHITPKITKRDFIKFIIESNKKSKMFEEPEPITKPRPANPDIDTDEDTDFDPFINPDPNDDPEARNPYESPTKPETKPRPAEPKPDEDTDFDPFIDPDPSDDPEAEGGDLSWFMKQVKKFGLYKR